MLALACSPSNAPSDGGLETLVYGEMREVLREGRSHGRVEVASVTHSDSAGVGRGVVLEDPAEAVRALDRDGVAPLEHRSCRGRRTSSFLREGAARLAAVGRRLTRHLRGWPPVSAQGCSKLRRTRGSGAALEPPLEGGTRVF